MSPAIADDPRISVDPTDPTPAFEQIRRQIVGHIAAGRLPIGARLPPLRQLARDLGIAVGTAAHAYRLLEQAGVITTRRGAGTRVTAVPDCTDTPSSELAQSVRRLADDYLAAAAAIGATSAQALDAVIRAAQTE
ncbi:GntR family transcriptional regulator [Gordonia sp. X0973]|uniref:GntR family transcriptional regulator n=1 Tax=Gordonia sp. X0973 TaxID=2742602 RepID=UPI000F53CF45|nr:GntR family transcriptional regulator [Gordonia sp. X0973]QKT06222.1 GntR family transcriptional regulator [Gordonia sp. X0973]